jgi:excisionase family DNA binding protein
MHQDTDQASPTGPSTTLPLPDDQAAKVLGISLQLVHQLIDEGELEAYRDEETELWLIESSSVDACLKKLCPELQGFDVSTTTAADSVQENRVFDREYLLGLIDYNDLLVLMLMIMGAIMVTTVVDTVATVLLSGG